MHQGLKGFRVFVWLRVLLHGLECSCVAVECSEAELAAREAKEVVDHMLKQRVLDTHATSTSTPQPSSHQHETFISSSSSSIINTSSSGVLVWSSWMAVAAYHTSCCILRRKGWRSSKTSAWSCCNCPTPRRWLRCRRHRYTHTRTHTQTHTRARACSGGREDAQRQERRQEGQGQGRGQVGRGRHAGGLHPGH